MLSGCLLGLAAAAAPAPPASQLGWTTTLLTEAAASTRAVCLDGTPAGYHIQHRGGNAAWTIHLQGGGWCTSVEDCLQRSKGALGSSKSFKTDMDGILGGYDGGAHGIFSTDPAVNPRFYNHTKAYIRYCDGASFAGSVDHPVVVGAETVHFRGRQVLDATLDSLLGAGLKDANLLIVNGCSAGGLAVYLHLDYIASRMPAGVRVVGAPECGFFMDLPHADGSPGYTNTYQNVAEMQNVTGSVNSACAAATPAADRWKCFMAQYTFPHVKTPAFVVNSFYDAWQWGAILNMPCKAPGCASSARCPAGARTALEGFRAAMIGNVTAAIAAGAPQHSGFLYACVTHCGQFSHDDRWATLVQATSPRGKSLRDSFTDWLDGKPAPLAVDCDGTGCNPTCCDSDRSSGVI